jgi:hypothetical protein
MYITEQGEPNLREALMHGASERLAPILMTALAEGKPSLSHCERITRHPKVGRPQADLSILIGSTKERHWAEGIRTVTEVFASTRNDLLPLVSATSARE